MKRCHLAIDVQEHYQPNPGLVQEINKFSRKYPTAATVFTHREDLIPVEKMIGEKGPANDSCLLHNAQVFERHGYTLPRGLVMWLKERNPEEVVVSGGFTDAKVLAAGFALFDVGIKPVLIPLLNYGNEWFNHTVTVKIWEKSIGPVHETPFDL
jgi:hypothetical protein